MDGWVGGWVGGLGGSSCAWCLFSGCVCAFLSVFSCGFVVCLFSGCVCAFLSVFFCCFVVFGICLIGLLCLLFLCCFFRGLCCSCCRKQQRPLPLPTHPLPPPPPRPRPLSRRQSLPALPAAALLGEKKLRSAKATRRRATPTATAPPSREHVSKRRPRARRGQGRGRVWGGVGARLAVLRHNRRRK